MDFLLLFVSHGARRTRTQFDYKLNQSRQYSSDTENGSERNSKRKRKGNSIKERCFSGRSKVLSDHYDNSSSHRVDARERESSLRLLCRCFCSNDVAQWHTARHGAVTMAWPMEEAR